MLGSILGFIKALFIGGLLISNPASAHQNQSLLDKNEFNAVTYTGCITIEKLSAMENSLGCPAAVFPEFFPKSTCQPNDKRCLNSAFVDKYARSHCPDCSSEDYEFLKNFVGSVIENKCEKINQPFEWK